MLSSFFLNCYTRFLPHGKVTYFIYLFIYFGSRCFFLTTWPFWLRWYINPRHWVRQFWIIFLIVLRAFFSVVNHSLRFTIFHDRYFFCQSRVLEIPKRKASFLCILDSLLIQFFALRFNRMLTHKPGSGWKWYYIWYLRLLGTAVFNMTEKWSIIPCVAKKFASFGSAVSEKAANVFRASRWRKLL